MLTYEEDGRAAAQAWLDRTGKRDDQRFRDLVAASLRAIPRIRDKGEFVRPEARVLEGLRATLFEDIPAPVEPKRRPTGRRRQRCSNDLGTRGSSTISMSADAETLVEPGPRDLDLEAPDTTRRTRRSRLLRPRPPRAVRYDRSVGFFRASALSVAAKGMARFIQSGGTARFLVGAEVAETDRDALIGAITIPDDFALRLAKELVPEDRDRPAEGEAEVLACGWSGGPTRDQSCSCRR